MNYTVYAIDCPEHDGGLGQPGAAVYFGITTLLRARLSHHAGKYSRCVFLRHWIRKRKEEGHNLRVTILAEGLANSAATKLEQALIRISKGGLYRTLNITDGGEGMSGFKFSAVSRQKLSRARQGNKNRLGIPHTPEIKAQISKTLKGRKLSAEHRAKISAALKGRRKNR